MTPELVDYKSEDSEMSEVPEESKDSDNIESASTPVIELEVKPKKLIKTINKAEKITQIDKVILTAIEVCKNEEKQMTSYNKIRQYASSNGVKDMSMFRETLKKMIDGDLVTKVTGRGLFGSYTLPSKKKQLRGRK